MTGSTRRIDRREEAMTLALPARREPRRLLVPELMPDERRRERVPLDIEVIVPYLIAWAEPYREPAPRPGLLVDVYG